MAGAASAQTEVDLREEAVSGEKEQARTALWMVLLLRLTALAVDHRPDIRNGVHTPFKLGKVLTSTRRHPNHLQDLRWDRRSIGSRNLGDLSPICGPQADRTKRRAAG